MSSENTANRKAAPFTQSGRKKSQPRSLYNSGSITDIGASGTSSQSKKRNTQFKTPMGSGTRAEIKANTSAAQQYLNSMAV